jgi:hypothetical protein
LLDREARETESAFLGVLPAGAFAQGGLYIGAPVNGVLNMRHDTLPETTDSNQRPAECVAQAPKLLDQVRQAIRARHYSKRTEKTYVDWIKRFIYFHGKRHPLQMGEPEINRFLTDLAIRKKVSASTQNQALSAILFLYQQVLNKPPEWVSPAV